MAEKYGVHPLAQAVHHDRSDEESTTLKFELHRKRKIKCFAYIATGVVFQIIIITVLALTVLRIKTPDVKLRSVTVQSLNTSTASTAASPSFSMTLIAEVTVKNKNFGEFKFDNSTVSFVYDSVTVGEGMIPKGQAKAKKTRQVNVTMEVTSERLSSDSNLRNDINSGILVLSSHTKMSGKVHLMKVMKKRKTTEMACNITVNLTSRVIQDLSCE